MDVPDPFTVTAEQWEHLLGLAKGRQRDLYLEYLNARQRRIKLNKVFYSYALVKVRSVFCDSYEISFLS